MLALEETLKDMREGNNRLEIELRRTQDQISLLRRKHDDDIKEIINDG